jgi:hypothetical protein
MHHIDEQPNERVVMKKSYTTQNIIKVSGLNTSNDSIIPEKIHCAPLPETVQVNEKSRGSLKKDSCWFGW